MLAQAHRGFSPTVLSFCAWKCFVLCEVVHNHCANVAPINTQWCSCMQIKIMYTKKCVSASSTRHRNRLLLPLVVRRTKKQQSCVISDFLCGQHTLLQLHKHTNTALVAGAGTWGFVCVCVPIRFDFSHTFQASTYTAAHFPQRWRIIVLISRT